MKKTLFLLVLFLSFSVGTSFGQIIPLPLGPCGPNSGTNITDNGNGTYSTTSNPLIQVYSWTVVSGNAVILSGNNTPTVTVTCNGPFTLGVISITGPKFKTNCVAFNCNSGCPSPKSLYFISRPVNDRCVDGTATVSGAPAGSSIAWTWSLGGSNGSATTSTNSYTFPFPVGNWDNQTIGICATVTLPGGTPCPEICIDRVLDCDDPFIFVRKKASVFPNPTADIVSIQTDNSLELSRVIVSDNQGNTIRSLEEDFEQEIDLSNEKKGTYFIRLLYQDGTSETKQLQLTR